MGCGPSKVEHLDDWMGKSHVTYVTIGKYELRND